ncbi:MAG TPA: hypothetical protein VMX79_02815 [bacterium]|nr:hypothetical protein [bacterium]
MITAAAAAAWADGTGVIAAEVGCGYVGGIGVGLAGIPVGNLFSSEQYAGGGLWGFLIAYPAGVGLGVYGAGEIWGDDAENDWASVGASVAAAYASAAAGYFTAKFKGLLIGMIAAPAASTAAYNLVKKSADENAESEGGGGFYVYTSFNF